MVCLLSMLGQAVLAGDHLGPSGRSLAGEAPLTEQGGPPAKIGDPNSPAPGGQATRSATLASGGGAGSSLPAVAASQYLKTVRTSVLSRLGCAEARRLGRSRQVSVIVVLAFGRPTKSRWRQGTSLFGAGFASTYQIEEAGRAYAGGYVRCSTPNAPYLHMALGTSNYGRGVTYRHGAVWASMVNRGNEWAAAQGYQGRLEFAGANDIELSWNGPTRSRAWVRGYDSRAQWPFYDFGDAAGCPPRGNCVGSWTQEDVWFVAWGSKSAWPLPQVYTPTGTMAQEWYRLSLYSYLHHGYRMTLVGALSQRYACRQSRDPCRGMNNAPTAAWNQLNRLINQDPRTAQPLPWLADFRWADR